MQNEKRQQPRFTAIGRVEADDICIFPGTLVNISSTGCRVRFPIHVSMDMEKEYELKVRLSHNTITREIVLIGQPIYNEGDTTSDVGLKLLRSPGSRQLDLFIQTCKDEAETDAYCSEPPYADTTDKTKHAEICRLT